MTVAYRLRRENPQRVPAVPCWLHPPLREVWSEQYASILWRLPLVEEGLLVRTLSPQGFVVQDEGGGNERWRCYQSITPELLHDEHVLGWSDERRLELKALADGRDVSILDCPVALEAMIDQEVLLGLDSDAAGRSVYGKKLSGRGVLWRFRPPERINTRGVPCAGNGVAWVGLDDGIVLALAVDQGKQLWHHSVADLTWHDPTFGARHGEPEGIFTFWNDLLIVRVQHGHVIALSARDGSRVWAWSHGQARTDDGYFYDGRYYVNSGLGTYHVLDPITGKELLRADLRATLPKKLQGLSPHGPMLVSETHTFIGTIEGYIVAFERDTGRYVWHHRPKGGTGMGSYLMSVNGRLYYTDMSFRLYCLEEKEPTDPVLKAQRGKG